MSQRHPRAATSGTRSGYPVDPDVDLHDPAQRRELRGHRVAVLALISLGGMLGAAARHGVTLALPTPPGALPWSTLLVNLSGCLLIGVLMAVLVERPRVHRLARPFLGVGVLGGYTTFSAYAVDAHSLLWAGRPAVAAAYVAATLGAALLAVAAGLAVGRSALPAARPTAPRDLP